MHPNVDSRTPDIILSLVTVKRISLSQNDVLPSHSNKMKVHFQHLHNITQFSNQRFFLLFIFPGQAASNVTGIIIIIFKNYLIPRAPNPDKVLPGRSLCLQTVVVLSD